MHGKGVWRRIKAQIGKTANEFAQRLIREVEEEFNTSQSEEEDEEEGIMEEEGQAIDQGDEEGILEIQYTK